MGNTCGRLFCKKDAHIVMLGLDKAGKTTLLEKLTTGEHIETQPTIGYNVYTEKGYIQCQRHNSM